MAFLPYNTILHVSSFLLFVNTVRSQDVSSTDWTSFQFQSVVGSFEDATFTFLYQHKNIFALPTSFTRAEVREPVSCGATSDPALSIASTTNDATTLTVTVAIDWSTLAQSVFWTGGGGNQQGVIRFCVQTGVGAQLTLLNQDTSRYTQLVDITSGFGDGASGLVPVDTPLTFAPAMTPTVAGPSGGAAPSVVGAPASPIMPGPSSPINGGPGPSSPVVAGTPTAPSDASPSVVGTPTSMVSNPSAAGEPTDVGSPSSGGGGTPTVGGTPSVVGGNPDGTSPIVGGTPSIDAPTVSSPSIVGGDGTPTDGATPSVVGSPDGSPIVGGTPSISNPDGSPTVGGAPSFGSPSVGEGTPTVGGTPTASIGGAPGPDGSLPSPVTGPAVGSAEESPSASLTQAPTTAVEIAYCLLDIDSTVFGDEQIYTWAPTEGTGARLPGQLCVYNRRPMTLEELKEELAAELEQSGRRRNRFIVRRTQEKTFDTLLPYDPLAYPLCNLLLVD
jgi:hypothetical protein